ncbi:hypothetical protein ABAC460_01065 [Asticcacaulis sp. AC460]|uniref:hypothetical protein n=1 Tax=Asticcacaulis sp. AC460 TaxID=1282360 RepID=UPI0003C3F007|nr:hypothetical protein [Asticcacaulis sp. AC460]ESQ93324.1 hypothetical protein ABAC460_01065 [Asticcacaulis sp. AC460]
MRFYTMIAGLVLGLTLGLSLAPDRAAAQSCGSDTHCKALKEKTRHLKARNPQTEAAAAAQAGDYRLGRMFRYGDPIAIATSDLPGLRCRIWPRSLVGKEHVSDDVITPGEDEHAEAVYEFLRRYNRTLVAAPGFPYADVCSIEEAAPQARYTGPVTTPAQAARSGDIARLEVLNATPEALNAPDELTVTPMGWAVDNEDAAMGLALADRGADPNALGGFDGRAPGLLGLLILKGDYDGARRVRDRGGKLAPDTGLCPERETIFDLTVLPPSTGAPDPDAVGEVGECSWAGLLLRRGQVDLLEHLLKTQVASDDIHGIPEAIDRGDLYAGFYQALRAGDMALAGRLSPYVVELADDPGFLSIWLYRHGQVEMAADKAQTVARSSVEARLWRRAVDAGHPQVFAELFDYGLHLNYLTAEQLADCEGAITGGDQAAVFTLCIRSSFLRAEGILAAVKSGDIDRFRHELDISSGLNEIYKPSLSTMVVRYGTAQMLDELNRRITLPDNWSMQVEPVDAGRGGHRVPLRQMYDAPLKAEIDAWVMPRMVYPDLPWPSVEPAMARGDLAMVRAMVRYKYPGVVSDIRRGLNVGNGPDGVVPGYRDVYPDTHDSELYPNAPTPEQMTLYAQYVPILAEAGEPKGLWEIVAHASAMGWNDVIVLAQANGFDAVRDGTPEIWMRLFNFSSVCKPSTAALLLKAGLPFPKDNTSRTYGHVLYSAVAVCADAETVRVLVRDAGISVNDDLFGSGTTALDVARQRGRTSVEAVLLELGGKPGKEVWPQTKAQMREGLDPDIWAGED